MISEANRIFDRDSKESLELANDWEVISLQCKEQGIKSGKVFGPDNPGLDVRFLVTVFPQVFYVKNGVAHEIPKFTKAKLIDIVKDKKWESLKHVSFLTNPFSVQMSLLSRLFIHAVALYNYEDAIVQNFVPFASATDIVFGLTIIIFGTIFGLLLTCALDIIHMMIFSGKDSDDEDDYKEDQKDKKIQDKKDQKDKKSQDKEDEAEESTEDKSVRKRK